MLSEICPATTWRISDLFCGRETNNVNVEGDHTSSLATSPWHHHLFLWGLNVQEINCRTVQLSPQRPLMVTVMTALFRSASISSYRFVRDGSVSQLKPQQQQLLLINQSLTCSLKVFHRTLNLSCCHGDVWVVITWLRCMWLKKKRGCRL